MSICDEDIVKMKSEELKAELRGRGQQVSGNRMALLNWLQQALVEKLPLKFSKLPNSRFVDTSEKKKKKKTEDKKEKGLRYF